MATIIGSMGVAGGIIGGVGGWALGGPTAAGLGASGGVEIGKRLGAWVFAGQIVEENKEKIINKAFEILDVARNLLIAGSCSYAYISMHSAVNERCKILPDNIACQVLPWIDVAIMTVTCFGMFYSFIKVYQVTNNNSSTRGDSRSKPEVDHAATPRETGKKFVGKLVQKLEESTELSKGVIDGSIDVGKKISAAACRSC